jgi:hypothetical protein
MARTGKIARLPREIREQVNTKLADGETGAQIVDWLNAQSEVRRVIASLFGGRPVNEQNVCSWRQGGYREHERKVAGLVDLIQLLKGKGNVE